MATLWNAEENKQAGALSHGVFIISHNNHWMSHRLSSCRQRWKFGNKQQALSRFGVYRPKTPYGYDRLHNFFYWPRHIWFGLLILIYHKNRYEKKTASKSGSVRIEGCKIKLNSHAHGKKCVSKFVLYGEETHMYVQHTMVANWTTSHVKIRMPPTNTKLLLEAICPMHHCKCKRHTK